MLPLIIPLVFYRGVKPYSGLRDIRDLVLGRKHLIDEILLKPFHLIDTHEIEDETLRQQQWVGIMAFVMKNISIRDVMNFIHLSMSYQERLDKANSKQLLIWAEKLMDANSPDTVFGE